MRIIKSIIKPEQETVSLVYRPNKDRYEVSEAGTEAVCVINGTLQDFLNIKADNIQYLVDEVNKELSLNHQEYSFHCDLKESNITQMTNFIIRVFVTRKSVELPYGVFNIGASGFSGELFIKAMPNDNTKPILVNPIDLTVYMEDIKKGSGNRKNKKGILLFGPPGTGKTSALFNLREYCTEANKTRMFFVSKRVYLSELNDLREFFKDDYTIFVFEEVTERLDKYGVEDILTFLDGENSWNNVLNVATSNYPEQLPPNIVDRPGRFDTFIELSFPSKEDITNLATAFGISDDISILFSKKLSYDYVSFIFDQSKLNNESVEITFNKQKELRKKISETFKNKMGLGI